MALSVIYETKSHIIFHDSKESLPSQVKVYYDSDWQEYQVRLYVNGDLIEDATYFTYDESDAIATAESMVSSSC